jgi:hypothetical protein
MGRRDLESATECKPESLGQMQAPDHQSWRNKILLHSVTRAWLKERCVELNFWLQFSQEAILQRIVPEIVSAEYVGIGNRHGDSECQR